MRAAFKNSSLARLFRVLASQEMFPRDGRSSLNLVGVDLVKSPREQIPRLTCRPRIRWRPSIAVRSRLRHRQAEQWKVVLN